MPCCRRRSAARCHRRRSSRLGGAAAAPADRETAELNLGYTELRAPIDGDDRQSQRACGAYATSARNSSRSCRRAASGSTPISRRTSSPTSGPASGDDRRGRAPGETFHGPCGEPGAGDGRAIQRIAAGERDRKFHQDRAARAGAHRARWRRGELGVLRPGLSVTPRSTSDCRRPPHARDRRAMAPRHGWRRAANCRWRRRCSPSRRCASASSLRCSISRSSPPRCGISAADCRPARTKSPGCRPAISSQRSS